jgi:hypothetical protein
LRNEHAARRIVLTEPLPEQLAAAWRTADLEVPVGDETP